MKIKNKKQFLCQLLLVAFSLGVVFSSALFFDVKFSFAAENCSYIRSDGTMHSDVSSGAEACAALCSNTSNGYKNCIFDESKTATTPVPALGSETDPEGMTGPQYNVALNPATNTPSTPEPKHFDYILLEGLPGFYNAKTSLTDLPAMILAIYKFGIWTVGIAGFFMLVVGGFMYIASAGNTSTANNANKIIWDAVLGIVAALGAYLILYVINPELTKINISFSTVNVEESEYGGTSEVDKGNQSTLGGCIKPVNEARKRASWVYSQALRGQTKNGVTYTDCSNFVESAYKAAGCSSPGSTTAGMYPKGQNWTSASSLKAGDAIVRNGHVVLCMDDGCNQIVHSPGTGKPITIKNGNYFTSKSGSWANAKVIKASSYCGGC